MSLTFFLSFLTTMDPSPQFSHFMPSLNEDIEPNEMLPNHHGHWETVQDKLLTLLPTTELVCI